MVNYSPVEFARSPRILEEYKNYKATEFRQFLLYTGPNVVEGLLKDDVYRHFLLLHIAMRILASSNISQAELFCAKQFLRLFVLHCEDIYGIEFLSYNVHGLLHVVDDVESLGPVDTYSTFPYENNMKIFGRYCRKPDLPLQQIANRIAEQGRWVQKNVHQNSCINPVTIHQHENGPLPAGMTESGIIQYSRVQGTKFTLDITNKNMCCIVKDGSVCLVYNIVLCPSGLHLVVKKFRLISSFIDVPIRASSIGYYKCSQLQDEFVLVRFVDVVTKGYLMPLWLPGRLEENDGEPRRCNEQFVEAAMSCAIHY